MARVGNMSYKIVWSRSPADAYARPAREKANRLRDELAAILAPIASAIQAAMRAGAKWVDRTGRARSGLVARIKRAGSSVSIVAGHTAPYGIWLEVRWGGRLAIVMPTLQSFYGQINDAMKRLVML
jgi:hypothetical protein